MAATTLPLPKSHTRPRWLPLLGALAIVLPSVVWMPSAHAALPPPTSVGGFEIDGDLDTDNPPVTIPPTPDTVPGTRDWADTVSATNPRTDGTGETDDILIQGNNGGKENSNPYVFDTGNVNDKDDLRKIWIDSRITSPTDAFIWAAFERVSGNGDAHVIFEFNQAPVSSFHVRTAGDLRVSYDFSGQGQNENTAVLIETWDGSGWVASGASGTATINSAVNQPPLGTVTTPDSPSRTLLERQFGEVGVNLASYFTNDNFTCANLNTVWARTRASSSETANAFDKAGPYAVNIDLCSEIQVKKVDDSGNLLNGVEFTLWIDEDGGTDGVLDVGTDTTWTCTTGADPWANGICGFEGLDVGTYHVMETAGLADYLVDTTVIGPIDLGYLKVVKIWEDGNGDGTTGDGYTFVNPRKTGTLTIDKVVVGTVPATDTFALQVDGATKATGGHGTTTGAMTLPTGDYTVGEVAAGTTVLADYTTTIDCGAGPVDGTSTTVSVTHDGAASCTITNTRKTGTIELRKELDPTIDLGTFDLFVKDGDGATVDSALDVGHGGTTGATTVNTGSYELSELAAGTHDLSDYVSTIACEDGPDSAVPATGDGPWTVSVGDGQDVICTITNVRKTGTLTIVKVLEPSDDPGTFDLTLDDDAVASGVGDGGTSGAMTLPTGQYTVGEVAASGTDLDDYTTMIACGDDDPVDGTSLSVDVTYQGDVTCTITNTRKTGTLTIEKVVVGDVPDTDTFALQLDDVTQATGGHGTTTGAMSLNTGDYGVSEIAAGTTDLADYVTTIDCGAGAVDGTSTTVSVGFGEDVTCTITNTRKTGTLTVVKDLEPDDDPGRFDLLVDGAVVVDEAADGDGTGAVTVNTGDYDIGEAAGDDTTLDDYVSRVSCVDGDDAVVASNREGADVTVSVGFGDDITCTITNTRKTGVLELIKDVSPDDDPGTFTLTIELEGGTVLAEAADVGDGGTTGEITVNTGTYVLREVAGTDTDLSDYTPGLSCVHEGTALAVQTTGDGPWTIDVGHNDDIDCTIVNARQTGTLTVEKVLQPSDDTGLFDLRIDGVAQATDVGDGGTTGAIQVNTGTHTVSEAAGTGTTLDDYVSMIVCSVRTEEGDELVAMTDPDVSTTTLDLAVGNEQDVVCRVFNTRKTGSLTIVKDVSPNSDDGRFDLLLDGAVVAAAVADGGTTGAMELNTGTYLVGEAAAAASVLSDYTIGVTCVDGEQTLATGTSASIQVAVAHDADVVCTFTNTRIPHDLTIRKIDASTQSPMAGVGFTLYASDGDGAFEPGSGDAALGGQRLTGADGTITWTDLQPGDYWVAETQAPSGHFGVAPRLVTIDDADVSITISNVPHNPQIDLEKTVDPAVVNVGEDATYTYVITNVGDVTLSGVMLVDDVLGTLLDRSAISNVSLAPQQSLTITVTQTFTEADLPGPVVNVATTTALAPSGAEVRDEATATVDLTSNPSIDVLKTPSDTGAEVGDEVTYTYLVTNTGDVTLTDVTAVDDVLGEVTLDATTLAPGASTSGTLTTTVLESDLPGPMVNTVVATGTPPVGDDVSDEDTVNVSLTSAPAIALDKNAEIEPSIDGFKTVAFEPDDGDDETVTYTYVVTNTGDVTLTDVTVVDDVLGPITLDLTTLAPGQLTLGTATHTVTTEDVLDGSIANVADATGIAPDGTVVEARDDELVFVTEVAPLIIERPPDPAPAPELPATGVDADRQAALALVAIALGALLLQTPRRRRPQEVDRT